MGLSPVIELINNVTEGLCPSVTNRWGRADKRPKGTQNYENY